MPNPPSLVYGNANTGLNAQSPPFINMHHGPWKFNGRFYDLVSTYDGTTPQLQMRMTNDPLAQPWVTLDQANGPTGNAGQSGGMLGCYSVINGGSVDVAYTYQDNTQLPASLVGPILIKTFTFSSTGGTWGGAIAGGPQPLWTLPNSPNRLCLTRLSNGNLVLTYNDDNGLNPGEDAWIALYNGVWQASIAVNDIDPGANLSRVQHILVDPSDRVAVMWRHTNDHQIRYSQFAAGALSASKVAADNSFSCQFNGLYFAPDDSINFVIVGPSGTVFQFLKGTPSANPAFTIVNTGLSLGEINAILPQGAVADGLFVVSQDAMISSSTDLGHSWTAGTRYTSNVMAGWGAYGFTNGGLVDVTSGTVYPRSIGPAIITDSDSTAVLGGEWYFNPVPPPAPQYGGYAKGPDPIPNQFDFCIHRENALYCSIPIAQLACGNIPACFTVDESEWGEG